MPIINNLMNLTESGRKLPDFCEVHENKQWLVSLVDPLSEILAYFAKQFRAEKRCYIDIPGEDPLVLIECQRDQHVFCDISPVEFEAKIRKLSEEALAGESSETVNEFVDLVTKYGMHSVAQAVQTIPLFLRP